MPERGTAAGSAFMGNVSKTTSEWPQSGPVDAVIVRMKLGAVVL